MSPNAGGTWQDAAHDDSTNPGVFPEQWADREQWMCHTHNEKKPFAPWGDRDHPDADPDDDARWKWGLEDNYTDLETALKWAEKHPETTGVTYLLREIDAEPFAFVDGDNVRDTETGEWHPAFVALLEDLGLTFADVSTSGSGVHAVYQGDLPDGVKQAKLILAEEPWGDNNDLPVAEIYDHKKVCVATGDHVPNTPIEVREWDDDALANHLDDHGLVPDEDGSADVHNRFNPAEYTPETTSREETTDDIRDVFAAIDSLGAQRVADRTIVHRWNDDTTTSDGERAFVPTWGPSANGTANIVNSERWVDTGGNGYGGVTAMAAIDAGLAKPDIQGAPSGEEWFAAVDHLRGLGFDVPELDRTAAVGDPMALLPDDDQTLETAASGWDWRHAGEERDATLSIETARERTVTAIADAYERGGQTLVEALPTTGKSYGSVAAASETNRPVTILTGRGRKEQYAQFREWADEHGLSHYSLPSFTHDCPSANGKEGEDWRETVTGWYERGATPQEIHKGAEHVLGHPLPCQTYDHQRCPYTAKWDFDPEDYHVLIGHYSHAYKAKVTSGRVVVLDEFPDAYETTLTHEVPPAVTRWLEDNDNIPFSNWADLRDHRTDDRRRADALLWFEEHGIDSDETTVMENHDAHTAAPLVVFGLLASTDLGNDFERARLPDNGGHFVYNRQTDKVSVLRPPELKYASAVVGLDGTPTPEMWKLAVGERLDHRRVLQDGERAEYVREALNLNLVRTSEHVKPYNNADNVNIEKDAALLEAIADKHDERPSVITTATAEDEYDATGVSAHIAKSKHYGNVLGSNEFDEVRLSAVVGSNHYGDGFVKRWGAYAGKAVERETGKGVDHSYTGIGDQFLKHMREHETLQAAMRFGRDGNGAVVYVHTNTLPDWVPLAGEGRVLSTWSDGMRDVIRAVKNLGAAHTSEIADHPDVGPKRRQVLDHLETLRERGVLTRQRDPEDGRRVVWQDAGLHRVGDHGTAELTAVELDDLTDDEVQALARTTNYTWEFRKIGSDTGDGLAEGRPSGPPVTAGGDRDHDDPV